ncbi:hypothetical protein EAG18_07660 [Pseudoalteromonas sp. J010]|uniref:multicopper oxidase family protein n=1 Tax=Pseudoalteromonas sp. J010 TaxID=998465 RepID=UPI000F654B68|nr:multicopper oxidase family protein [Pseudoalteromonas sp. J010]RRS09308.1 hypothetical protein EAG18_07660 [Pseudoalteromonas sp. J010]
MKNPILPILGVVMTASCTSVEHSHESHTADHPNHSEQHKVFEPNYFDLRDYNPVNITPEFISAAHTQGVNSCDYQYIAPELDKFVAPDVIQSKDGSLNFTLAVKYHEREIAGCNTWLRNYAYKQDGQKEFKPAPVGPTLKVAPGDVLRFTLENRLPSCELAPDYLCSGKGHAGHHSNAMLSDEEANHINTPHNFNVTNFHTHGLWVSPSERSDNVLLEIQPGQGFEYEVRIPESHPQGTFWYHAHVHGSTALQVSSGMAGAIIIEGGNPKKDIGTQAQIKDKTDQLFVLQQVAYDCNGTIEYYEADERPEYVKDCKADDKALNIFGPGDWQKTKRRTLINGQVVPQIEMRPNEIQRWRFIHAGVRETIKLSVIDKPEWENNMNPVSLGFLNQISVDGLNTGRIDRWQLDGQKTEIEALQPGYRADYLYQAPSKAGVYWLVDLDSAPQKSLQGVPEDTAELLQIVVKGEPVASKDAVLPTSAELISYRAHDAPTQGEIAAMDNSENKESMMFYLGSRVSVNAAIATAKQEKKDFNCQNIWNEDINNGVLLDNHHLSDKEKDNDTIFSVDGKPYGQIETRELTLGTWQRWDLCTRGLAPMHPFHIHVNPFYAPRVGPDGKEQWVWRDTLAIEKGADKPQTDKNGVNLSGSAPHTVVYSKYRYPESLPGFNGNVKQQYTGEFVLHCHILDHEDQGMMQKVKLIESK